MNEPQLTAEMNETMSAYMMKCPHCQTIIDLPQEKETPMQNEPQLSAEMEKRFDEEFDHFVLDVGESGETVDWDRVKHFLATALEEQEKEYFEKINIKNKTIEHMMEEIRYLRSSQPARRKPIIRIKNGDRWYIPMITQAHDTPDGLYIEAELAILNGKE